MLGTLLRFALFRRTGRLSEESLSRGHLFNFLEESSSGVELLGWRGVEPLIWDISLF